MDQESLFRKSSLDRISSPEDLTDYLHVTNPAVWVVMVAIILVLVGFLIWGSIATINSFVSGTAVVQNGKMTVTFDDPQYAQYVETGMTVTVGETSSVITSVGRTDSGAVIASSQTTLADGTYSARVVFRSTQVIDLLLR